MAGHPATVEIKPGRVLAKSIAEDPAAVSYDNVILRGNANDVYTWKKPFVSPSRPAGDVPVRAVPLLSTFATVCLKGDRRGLLSDCIVEYFFEAVQPSPHRMNYLVLMTHHVHPELAAISPVRN